MCSQATLHTLTEGVVNTSEIAEEILAPDQVRRRLQTASVWISALDCRPPKTDHGVPPPEAQSAHNPVSGPLAKPAGLPGLGTPVRQLAQTEITTTSDRTHPRAGLQPLAHGGPQFARAALAHSRRRRTQRRLGVRTEDHGLRPVPPPRCLASMVTPGIMSLRPPSRLNHAMSRQNSHHRPTRVRSRSTAISARTSAVSLPVKPRP